MSENQALTTELRQHVVEIIAEVLEAEPTEVLDGSSFENDLEADSLSMIEIISRFERQLGLRLPPERLGDLDTVSDMFGMIDGILQTETAGV